MLYIKIFFFYLKAHFILLILKEIKIFSWAPRSTMGPQAPSMFFLKTQT